MTLCPTSASGRRQLSPRRSTRLVASWLAAALAAVALLGCTSSGDGGVTAANNFANEGATWTSDGGTAGKRVWMVQTVDERDRACLEVRAAVVDLYSVAFTLTYDPAIMSLSSSSVGGLLGAESDLIYQVEEVSPGEIVVGISRSAAVTEDGATGEGVLLTICFDLNLASAGTRVVFDSVANREGVDFDGNQEIDDWLGGTFVIK